MYFYIKTADWRSPISFWRVSIYILEAKIVILEAKIVLGVLYRKRGDPQKGWYFGFPRGSEVNFSRSSCDWACD